MTHVHYHLTLSLFRLPWSHNHHPSAVISEPDKVITELDEVITELCKVIIEPRLGTPTLPPESVFISARRGPITAAHSAKSSPSSTKS